MCNVNGVHFNALVNANMIDLPIHAIRASDESKLAATGAEWIKLEDYVREKVESIKDDVKIARYVIARSVVKATKNAVDN